MSVFSKDMIFFNIKISVNDLFSAKGFGRVCNHERECKTFLNCDEKCTCLPTHHILYDPERCKLSKFLIKSDSTLI